MNKYSIVRDVLDERDFILDHVAELGFDGVKKVLPVVTDLRNKMSPVVDQGQLGSCTANAIVSGLREYLILKSGKTLDTRLSRLFLYWHERAIEGTINEDSGAMIRDGFKVLQRIGVCPEKDFPYDISTFRNAPTNTAETDAAAYRITTYKRITSLNALKASLANGIPVVFGFEVYESFESEQVAKTGIMPIPNPAVEQNFGGHAVIAVGYDDTKQQVIVRNSWGEGWGDKGHFYMPYSLFSTNIIMDMWTGQ